MDKATLIDKIKTGNYDKEKLLGWVNAMSGTCHIKKPTVSLIGDVYMHSIFLHPYVLLEYRNDYWICGLITSEPECAEIIDKCQSRFWPEGYFVRVLFSVKEPSGRYMMPYENDKHLKEILKRLRHDLK